MNKYRGACWQEWLKKKREQDKCDEEIADHLTEMWAKHEEARKCGVILSIPTWNAAKFSWQINKLFEEDARKESL